MTRSLIVGAGSIGVRHATVLEAAGHEVAFVSRRTDLVHPVFATVIDAVRTFEPSYVVIATETSLHSDSFAQLVESGFTGPVLVEKPLAIPLAQSTGAPFDRIGVGFNLRFHPVIQALSAAIDGATIYTVEAYAGQDLRTWRPGRPAESQYSSSAARGGGVLRDLSHELDYLGWMLGECLGVFARGGRLASITTDSDDAWGIVAQYEHAPVVTLQLNYLDTRTRRRLVLNTSIGTVEADVIGSTLTINDAIETFPIEPSGSYSALHRAMAISDSPVATVREAAQTDRVIEMIEQSAAEEKWIRRQ